MKVNAIVINSQDIKEKDKLITLYTLENGKMTVSMKGVRGDKAKLKSAKEIFCFGDFIIEEGKINIVTGVDIVDNFYDLTKDLDRYFEGCAILDIVNKISTNESNPQLFIEVIKALRALCYGNLKKFYVIDKFLISVLNSLGYGFITDRCSSCGEKLNLRYLNLDIGELVCPACHNSYCIKIEPTCYNALKILQNSEYEKLNTVNIGGFGEVQSFDILKKDFEMRTGYSVIKI